MKPQLIFKQKILVTLIASALGLTTANTNAGECNILGAEASASGATPVSTGPLNPINGFPEFVTDSNGVSVQRCTDLALCFFDPIIPTDPFSVQIGTGGEAFYWSAAAVVNNAAGNNVLNVEFAAETAFLQNGPNGEPINGSQLPFLRMRFVMHVPVDGTYTVKHPYGTDTFVVVSATGNRDVFSTIDRGFAPNEQGVQGPAGPFLISVSAPAGYMGDTNVADLVTGSPCGTAEAPWNFVEVSGLDTQGNPVDFGNGEAVVHTDNFNVQGKLYDGQVQTPLMPTRVSYSRSAAGQAQIDTFATSTSTASVTVTDGPTNPVGSAQIGEPLMLDRSAINLTEAVDSLSVLVATENAAKLPSILQLSASDTLTDETSLNLHLVDFVDIAVADYDPATDTLSVTASSSDQRLSPLLTLRDFGNFTAGSPTKLVVTTAPPAEVHVDSAEGGTAVAKVRVVDSVAPSAPTSLGLLKAASTSLTLKWVDNSSNEQGFRVYSVDATTGLRTLKTTVLANTLQATVTGLTAEKTYTFQVEAFNLAGENSSTSFTTQTLALPLAPSGVSAVLSSNVSRGIEVSWADNSSDETSFSISRSITVGGIYTEVATAAAGATLVVDSTVKANGTPYFYKVAAVRDTDSNSSLASATIVTPTAPTSAGTPTLSALSPTSVRVTWADRSANESGFQVYRATVTGAIVGPYVAVSGLLPANSLTFDDVTVAVSTSYKYRVDVSNWAAAVASTASATLTTATPVLSAPSALTATSALKPVLGWADTNTFETGYRVSARPITFTAAGASTNGALTNLTPNPGLVPGSIGYTEARALTANALYQYSVSGLNGATVGTAATVYAVPGGIPTPTNLTATRPITGTAAAQSLVTLRWTALTAPAVGAYKVERCTVTTAQNCNGSTDWVAATTNPATIAGRTRATATSTVPTTVGITYRFRLIATTGTVNTGITSLPSAIVSITR